MRQVPVGPSTALRIGCQSAIGVAGSFLRPRTSGYADPSTFESPFELLRRRRRGSAGAERTLSEPLLHGLVRGLPRLGAGQEDVVQRAVDPGDGDLSPEAGRGAGDVVD